MATPAGQRCKQAACHAPVVRIYVEAGGLARKPERVNLLVLRPSNWNDFWKYATLFHATYYDEDGQEHELGAVKIGEFGLEPAIKHAGAAPASPTLPQEPVESLPEATFSLGQEASYYKRVNDLGHLARDTVLRGLRDVAFDEVLLARARDEYVFSESLMRDLSLFEVTRQWTRIAKGGALLTSYDFTYEAPKYMSPHMLEMDFKVTPEVLPPSNIHVLIGRNGVGKSTLLQSMAQALVPERQSTSDVGAFSFGDESFDGFANVVSVSYSVFDRYDPVDMNRLTEAGYSHIGHGSRDSRGDNTTSEYGALAPAAEKCSRGAKKARLVQALRILENDPMFEEHGLCSLLEDEPADVFQATLPAVYAELSSGHKIVLSSTMQLVEAVEEKTLVLIDEPETHLHPPLLSAYVRALSELLVNRNGVAIIATHSPVVLQEVPATCVWRVERSERVSSASRLSVETFGENVGLLTNAVFGLEVTATGYHSILTKLAISASTYEAALGELGGQLGAEGRALLRSRMLRDLVQRR